MVIVAGAQQHARRVHPSHGSGGQIAQPHNQPPPHLFLGDVRNQSGYDCPAERQGGVNRCRGPMRKTNCEYPIFGLGTGCNTVKQNPEIDIALPGCELLSTKRDSIPRERRKTSYRRNKNPSINGQINILQQDLLDGTHRLFRCQSRRTVEKIGFQETSEPNSKHRHPAPGYTVFILFGADLLLMLTCT